MTKNSLGTTALVEARLKGVLGVLLVYLLSCWLVQGNRAHLIVLPLVNDGPSEVPERAWGFHLGSGW